MGVKIGAKATQKITAGIPLASSETTIEISVEVNTQLTWGESTSVTKTWGFKQELSGQPHALTVAFIVVKNARLSVPYTVTGIAAFKSGVKVPVTIEGVFIGNNTFDLRTVIHRYPYNEAETEVIVKQIANTESYDGF